MQRISSLCRTHSICPHGRCVEWLQSLRCSQKSQGKAETHHNVRTTKYNVGSHPPHSWPRAPDHPYTCKHCKHWAIAVLEEGRKRRREERRREGEGQTCPPGDWGTLPAECNICWEERMGGRTLNFWHNSFYALRSGGIWEQGPKMYLTHVVAKLHPFW